MHTIRLLNFCIHARAYLAELQVFRSETGKTKPRLGDLQGARMGLTSQLRVLHWHAAATASVDLGMCFIYSPDKVT